MADPVFDSGLPIDKNDPQIQCLDILRSAVSDNEKLAGLLLVPKLCQENSSEKGDPTNNTTVTGSTSERSVHSIEFKKQLIEAIEWEFIGKLLKSKSNKSGDGSSYQLVALSILSCLVDDGVMTDDQINDVIQAIVNTISAIEDPNTDDNQKLLDGCVECLTGLCQNQMPVVLENVILSPLLQHTSNTSQTYLLNLMATLCAKTVARRGSLWMSPETKLLSSTVVLRSLKDSEPGSADISSCRVAATLHLGLETRSYTEPYLQLVDDTIRRLNTVLRSKLPAKQRQDVLILLTALVQTRGIGELVKQNGSKPALLLIHLCCIEVRLTLESDDMQMVKNSSEILCSCFFALEQMIFYMAHEQDTLALDSKEILQVHSALHGAVSAILYFINEYSQSEMSDSFLYPTTAACIRLLGAWTAEDTESIIDKYNEALPALCTVCSRLLSELDSFKYIVPGLSNLTTDSEATVKAIIDQLSFIGAYIEYCCTHLIQKKTEYDHVLVNACVVVLNCTMMPNMKLETQPVTDLFHVLRVQIGNIRDICTNKDCVYTTMSCALALLRRLHENTKGDESNRLDWLETEEMIAFYKSVVEYVLKVDQQSIPEIWLMAVQVLSVLMEMNKPLGNILLEDVHIRNALKLFEIHSSKPEVAFVLERLLIIMASKSGAAKELIQEVKKTATSDTKKPSTADTKKAAISNAKKKSRGK